MKELPIIYLVHDLVAPPSTEIMSAEMAAWLNGWCPVRPPSYSPPAPTGTTTKKTPFYAGRVHVDETLLRAIDSLLGIADATLVVGDKLSDTMSVQLERLTINRVPAYAMTPSVQFNSKKLTPPPFHLWSDAAKWVEIKGWACKKCSRLSGVGDHAERIARWCCAEEAPCSDCGKMTSKSYSLCHGCSETAAVKRHAKREKKPWNDLMLWSDAGDRWFDDLDAAIDHAASELYGESEDQVFYEGSTNDKGIDDRHKPTDAEILEKLEDMRLLLAEPITARPFELIDHVRDDLPSEDDGDPDLSGCDAAVDALNKALEELGPLSYNHTNIALDVATVDLGSQA